MTDATRPAASTDRLATIPNLVTLVRLCCLPLFLYLLFGRDDRVAAAWLLGGLGATDWVDGYLARRLGQVSEFGKKFDPTVDRLLFIVGVGGILLDGVPPTWFFVLVLVREILVGAMMAIATLAFGMVRFDVTWLGKLATFLLMFAVPGFLLGASDMPGAGGFEIASWLMGVPGLALSWYVGVMYVPKVRAAIRAGRTAEAGAAS
ncbi:MAG: CDP-alcohol phosphatidyltransferase family protein [Desertimonas sp.]